MQGVRKAAPCRANKSVPARDNFVACGGRAELRSRRRLSRMRPMDFMSIAIASKSLPRAPKRGREAGWQWFCSAPIRILSRSTESACEM